MKLKMEDMLYKEQIESDWKKKITEDQRWNELIEHIKVSKENYEKNILKKHLKIKTKKPSRTAIIYQSIMFTDNPEGDPPT